MPCGTRGDPGAPVRIVLDTTVVVSALLWHGAPYRLPEAARQSEQVKLFTSTALLEELAEVLLRPVAAKRLGTVGRSARELLADYVDAVDLVTPLAVPRLVASDPDDDHVVAAAIASEAALIVSGDRHPLTLGTHRGIRIVTPAEAIGIIAR